MFTKQLFSRRPNLRNREQGRSVFILGNGPSILSEDLSLLSGQVTIGMNASTLLEKKYGFIQSYYCLSDARFIGHEEKRKYATTELSSQTVRVVRKDLISHDNPDLVDGTYYIPHIARDGFSCDLGLGFYYGCTTTMLAVQLAFYLGCVDIYLLGVDLRYRVESPRFYKETNPQLEDSFTSVQIWNLANAGHVVSKFGRKLINCSENSLLRPYLPFVNLPQVFA